MAEFSIQDLDHQKKDRRILAPKFLRKIMFDLADQHLMDDVAILAIQDKFTEDKELTDSEVKTLNRFKKLAERSAHRRLQAMLSKLFKTR